jgi:hypothetical protein
MRITILRTPLKILLVVASAMVLTSIIDPYLSLTSPITAQLVNTVLPLLLLLLIWGLSGRAWIALAGEVALLLVLRYADHMKSMYLDSNLVYADFTVIKDLLKEPSLVLGFIHLTSKGILSATALFVAFLAACWLTRKQPAASLALRVNCLAIVASAGAVICTKRLPDTIDSLDWTLYSQISDARLVGITGNILLGRMTIADLKRPPDAKAEQAFWNEPLVRAAERQLPANDSNLHPDIVIVQSESLFEPSQLCGFTDAPVLQRVGKERPSLPGNLHVPVFGGRTLQTEFEVLTGAPIWFYPGSMFAYYELLDRPVDALPHALDNLGYSTLAMHPNGRGFWRRGEVMPEMGFGTFQDIGSFIGPLDLSDRDHVTDMALMRSILAELDAASGPTFIMSISMDNHGPWGDFAPKDESNLSLPASLHGEARKEMADYIAHAIKADDAYGYLLDALKRRGRPTVVLLYGDHLPALSAVYKQLCFKDHKPPEQHYPPYRIWANFRLPPLPDTTSSYLLQGLLLRAAGLPLRDHILANALAGIVASDPTTPAGDRKRILDEYANIAAASLNNPIGPPHMDPNTLFIGNDQAWDLLLRHETPSRTNDGVSVSDGDLFIRSSKSASTDIALDLNNSVASLTLRPYVQCLSDDVSGKMQLTVDGDDRPLYRATLGPRDLRLATMNLRGVRHLTLHVSMADVGIACPGVYIRAAQMLCYSADCSKPGPLPSSPPGPARILTQDPMVADIAALPGKTLPSEQESINRRIINAKWMINHETNSRQGEMPFSIQWDGRLFMHPAEDHPAWIDFSVSDLAALNLSPRIDPLSPECQAMNKPGMEAGLIGLSMSLDGKPVAPHTIVDRHYTERLHLALHGGRTLRITVDKGNNTTACDWFAIGFDALTASASDQAPAEPTETTTNVPANLRDEAHAQN